jgi:hypothetical protein
VNIVQAAPVDVAEGDTDYMTIINNLSKQMNDALATQREELAQVQDNLVKVDQDLQNLALKTNSDF